MTAQRRSAHEIAEELRNLLARGDKDRNRAALLHEVQVYQEELTVQNEALREMQATVEETRDRFIELYDFAPTAYITVDEHGVLRQVNLTAASWLGKSKQALEGMPLLGFDKRGTRLGYGGGYYDRTLERLSKRPRLVGIAFAAQELEDIPREAHDVPLDTIVTEAGARHFEHMPA